MSRWLLVSAVVSVGAVAACHRSSPPPSAPAPGAEAEQRIVDASAEAIRRLRGDAKFASLNDRLKDAKGVLVFPRLIRASFILGGEGGTGVLMGRNADGSFSAPAFYAIGSGSIGPQIGYREATVVLLLMTDRAVSAVLHSGLTLGANASVAAGSDTGEGRASTSTRDVIAYVDVGGVFAGASVDGAVVEPRQKLDDAYYGTSASPWDIVLNHRYDHPGARALRDALTSPVAAKEPAVAGAPASAATAALGTGTPASADLAPPPGEQHACSPESRQAEACTMIYAPVCGVVDTGIRCVTTPCPSAKYADFSNACTACKDSKTMAYYVGNCVQGAGKR